jgi:valyl-tRNA synthetase
MALPRSERSGTPVEPMISTQWFVKMGPLAAPALEAVESGKTRFVPKKWENTYYSWMREIRDWCISRQLWWGHQIPAWYCQDCEAITVSREDATACQACGSSKLVQDEDVLDTWFSSALWPFSTMGWPEQTADLERYYPTSVLVTGFDIIFFWVARMMFSGLHLMDHVPFSDVYINSIVRDSKGDKMSKTKGNGIDPLVAIDEVGADAFRFTLAALAVQGRDILWNQSRVEGYARFQNKIWQAFRFAMMHLEDYDPSAERSPSPYDHWIRARTGESVRRVRTALDDYRFNEAAGEIYAFTWDELCDWYLEFAKGPLYSDTATPAEKQAARHTLWEVLQTVARMMHPFMPFLSEEIWQQLPGTEGSIMVASYPKASDFPVDPESLAEVATLQAIIVEIRRLRADMELSPRLPLALRTKDCALLEKNTHALRDLSGITDVQAGERTGPCATFVVQGCEYYVPLEGVVDIAAELARLDKVLEKVSNDIAGLNKRLNNPRFTDRAPAEVVAEVQTKHDAATDKLTRLKQARTSLA